MLAQDFADIDGTEMGDPLYNLGGHRHGRCFDGSSHFLEHATALMKELADEIVPSSAQTLKVQSELRFFHNALR